MPTHMSRNFETNICYEQNFKISTKDVNGNRLFNTAANTIQHQPLGQI